MRKPGAKAFISFKGKLLLILRDNNPSIPSPNTWNLPGGGIEDGELPEEAVKREIQEELNISPRLRYLGQQTYSDSSVVYRYFVELQPDELEKIELGDEGQKYEFFTMKEIDNIQLSGYLQEYFLNYSEAISRLLGGERLESEDLGLTV